jgi:hypothetical protein
VAWTWKVSSKLVSSDEPLAVTARRNSPPSRAPPPLVKLTTLLNGSSVRGSISKRSMRWSGMQPPQM